MWVESRHYAAFASGAGLTDMGTRPDNQGLTYCGSGAARTVLPIKLKSVDVAPTIAHKA